MYFTKMVRKQSEATSWKIQWPLFGLGPSICLDGSIYYVSKNMAIFTHPPTSFSKHQKTENHHPSSVRKHQKIENHHLTSLKKHQQIENHDPTFIRKNQKSKNQHQTTLKKHTKNHELSTCQIIINQAEPKVYWTLARNIHP